jgi:hypothetical protein
MANATQETTTVLAPKFTPEYTAARTAAVVAGKSANRTVHDFIREQFNYVQGAGKNGATKQEQVGLIRSAIIAVRDDFRAFRMELDVSEQTAGVEASRVKALLEMAIMGDKGALKWLKPLPEGAKKSIPLQTWYATRNGPVTPKNPEPPKAPGVAPERENKAPETVVESAPAVPVNVTGALAVAKEAIRTIMGMKGKEATAALAEIRAMLAEV